MQDLTEAARARVTEIAARHGVSAEAATTLLRALAAGGGGMAQFSHPELGGLGQWSQGGMIMIGDMFNNGLKARVDMLCQELAAVLREMPVFAPPPPAIGQMQTQGGSFGGFAPSFGNWWPVELGLPSSSGAQNEMRYAYFPQSGRLAVQLGGAMRLYDTGGVQVFGVSQQQGGGQSLSFSTSAGEVRLQDLRPLDAPAPAPAPAPVTSPEPAFNPPTPQAATVAPPAPAAPVGDDPLSMLERLASLHQRGILTDAEFAAKKAELLARL